MFLHKFVMMCKLNDYFPQEIDFFLLRNLNCFSGWNLDFVLPGCWQIYKSIDDAFILTR